MTLSTPLWGRLHRDEDGQAFPIILVAVVALLATGVVLTQTGRLTELRASAATAADASALAAADELADWLEGPGGISYLASGTIDPAARGSAAGAASAYADANDATIAGFQVTPVDRRTVVVRTRTESRRTIDEPSFGDPIAQARGEAVAAAIVELGFSAPSDRGCLSAGQVAAIATNAGLDPPAGSGLISCGGADVRNLRPELHEAVLRIEGVMGTNVQFTVGYVTIGEQLDRWRSGHALPPGTSLLHWGLAFEAANNAAIVAALAGAEAEDRQLCRPHAFAVPRYFSHDEYSECGGSRPRPAIAHIGITAEDPRLIDPERLP